MPLPEMRLRFVTEFEHYLLTIDKLQSNTAHKYIKNLKKIMNMAVGLDWIPSNPFNQFKCSYSNPEREILNQDEINLIINKNYTHHAWKKSGTYSSFVATQVLPIPMYMSSDKMQS